MLAKDDIAELRQIYLEETGEDISMDEAWEMGRRLLRFAELMLKIPESSTNRDDQGSIPVPFDQKARNS